MPATVVLIGESTSAFAAPLEKQYTTYWSRSGKSGLAVARTQPGAVIVVDAISLGTNGERICKMLRQALPEMVLLHIHPGPKGEVNSPADMVLLAPLSPRTLINTIQHLMSNTATTLLHCGPFGLDVDRAILRVQGNEITLTPKQAALIEVFLRHPNQTLDRKWLMQQVWNTDYTGDTRTLSVHIRFVREILEADASDPQYLKTVRGIGYRLELPENEKPTP